MATRQYFGIADTVSSEGQIRAHGDIMLLEFTHISYRNEEERIVISIDEHVAEGLLRILDEYVTLHKERK